MLILVLKPVVNMLNIHLYVTVNRPSRTNWLTFSMERDREQNHIFLRAIM